MAKRPAPQSASTLPSFEQRCLVADRLLRLAQQELRAEWADGTGPDREQADHLYWTRQRIAEARTELDKTTQRAPNAQRPRR